jgi:ornithine cyclodeaminase/alanine dehydrogenase-like protein (mu-crystallin family)
LFKSVGSALEDLATAALVWQDRQQQAAMVDGCALSVH